MNEIDRLKAENASLRKNLDDYAGCVARMEEKLAAAEKERDETRRSADGIAGELANWRAMADRNTKALAAAEQRNTELEGALRLIEKEAGTGFRDFAWVRLHARAALHDEERSAPPPQEEK